SEASMTNDPKLEEDLLPEPILSTAERIVKQKIREGKIVGLDLFEEEEQREAIIELAELYVSNRIAYELRRNELQELFGVSRGAIDNVVKKLVDAALPSLSNLNDPEEIINELIAIAKREAQLWQDTARVGFASFTRDGHIEHHKIEGRDFQDFIADKFGE